MRRSLTISLLVFLLSASASAAPPAVWTPNGQTIEATPRQSSSAVKTVDVLVIGAGVAGLTVAKDVKKAGRKVALVEAANRIGGRVFTNDEGADLGAAWNHNADNNRLADEVYGPLGAKQLTSHLDRYLFISKRRNEPARAATPEETADFRKAKDRVERLARRDLKRGKDAPAGKFSKKYGGKWGQLIADELGELDAGVSLDKASGADVYGFGGGGSKDRMIEGGLGRFFTQVYAEGVEAQLNTAVESVDTHDPQWTVVRMKNGETYRARTVVNTTSTGVLAKGRIAFSPALPSWKTQAIENLRMGLFNKIILEFKDDSFMTYNGEKIDENAWVMNQVEGAEEFAFVVRPSYKTNSIVAFVGGDLARRLEKMGDERASMLALKHLKRMFGDVVKEQFVKSTVTRWGSNPFTEGSYSNATVRDLTAPFAEGDARSPKEYKIGKKLEWHELLAEPVKDDQGRDRIYFAGEAVGMGNRRLNRLYQTSVAGAYVSAKVAAEKIVAQLKAEDKAQAR